MAKLFLAIVIILSGCQQIDPNPLPSEDSDLAQQIWGQAQDTWLDMLIPCGPVPIYTKFDDGRVYIGIIGDCTDMSIGAYFTSDGKTNGMEIE